MSQTMFVQNGEYKGSVDVSDVETCRHPNAQATGDTCSDGCCDYYQCPDCGRRFLVECPD